MAMPASATAIRSGVPAARPAARGASPTGPRTVVARLTGLTTDQVAEQIVGGASLATVAGRAGVARGDLVAALAAHAPEALRATGRAEEIINRVVDEVGEIDRPGGTEAALAAVSPTVISTAPRPRAHRTATGLMTDITTTEQREALGGIAELLGLDVGELTGRLRDGADLLSMLAAAGFERPAVARTLGRGVLFDATA